MSPPSVLELRNVTWGPKHAPAILHDISFALAAGEILAICGANGAGKSSLLRLLYRHQAPLSGSVLIEGRDLWLTPAREAARSVAAVLQEQPTDFALTTREIVSLGRLPHRQGMGPGRKDKAITDAALLRMDLCHLSDRRFGTLSGGERQRVMVARALAQEPRILVLDEPTNHLDIRHQLELLRLLRGLGLAVVCTLHDLTLAAEFADRVLILNQGRIIADAPPDAALTETTIARAFCVIPRIDRTGASPRFSFQLEP
ncbi:MAG: ABC transporter ATP-binding protein [Tabrizicola sp.]|jgi:iron complex transport system ATP-binding protein|uniref:ABC transporter ATP-binding protein n=1 Tax=Tabrizicola sp. TaxID=2005166 RepID=UPI001B5A8BE4|nr:ABC transporter ATP-binding protein [Fuscovulum sp.]MCC6517292.1 ABC transporter ATP-binding protein [Tabrizicola sp.]